MRTSFTRSFTDPREAEEAIESAKDLGFEPVKFRLTGTWEAEGEPFFGDDCDDFVKAGSKYFHLRMDVDNFSREIWRCEPKEDDVLENGALVVTFRD